MTTDEFVNAAWLKAEGEVPTFAFGADEYKAVLGYGNYYINRWPREYGYDPFSLYDPAYSLGTAAATASVDLDTTIIRKLSTELGDSIRIAWLDGIHYTDYDLVAPNELRNYTGQNVVARVGSTLRFAKPITTVAAEYAGIITVPMYTYPTLLAKARDVVPVDDPNWLVCVAAYEIAVHDILRKDTAAGLLAESNDILLRMIADNEQAQLSVMGTSWTPGDSS